MKKETQKVIQQILIGFLAWGLVPASLLAQFGGRSGDVVLFLLSSKGPMDFQTVSPTATNSSTALAQFKALDSANLPDEPFPGFTTDFTTMKVLHKESDNQFLLVTQYEKIVGPPRTFPAIYKSFIISGFTQDTKNLVEFPAGAGVSLRPGKEFGNDLALDIAKALFWLPVPQFPTVGSAFQGLPQLGPEDAIVPSLIPWDNLRRLYPSGRWQDGIDRKMLDKDETVNATMALLRVRPGRQTPLFRIPAATHVYVLEGNLTMMVPGLGQVNLPTNRYAFVPSGLVMSLLNFKAYDGPVPTP